jgi:hypothetical protein
MSANTRMRLKLPTRLRRFGNCFAKNPRFILLLFFPERLVEAALGQLTGIVNVWPGERLTGLLSDCAS